MLLAGPLALSLHHPQTTLDYPDRMSTFFLGHVQAGYQTDGVGPGGEEEHASMTSPFDQFGRSVGVRKGDPAHQSSTADGSGDDRGEHLGEASEEGIEMRGGGTHRGEKVGVRETGDDVVPDPGG